MLAEYSISDIVISGLNENPFYAGTFEGTEDPDIEWPHRHDFYSLVWFTDGSGINVIDFEEYKIKPDRLFLTQPGQIHNWSYSEDTKGYILIFDNYSISNFPPELPDFVFFDLNSPNTIFVKTLFDNLITESENNDSLSKQFIHTGIRLLLMRLLRLSSVETKQRIKSEKLLKFIQLISETVSDKLTVTDYADKLHITVEKLNEICKENYGQTPKTIILGQKITEAKRLLYFSSFSIKEISYQLGFEDSSYFSRIFKQKAGYSPSEFKNKNAR